MSDDEVKVYCDRLPEEKLNIFTKIFVKTIVTVMNPKVIFGSTGTVLAAAALGLYMHNPPDINRPIMTIDEIANENYNTLGEAFFDLKSSGFEESGPAWSESGSELCTPFSDNQKILDSSIMLFQVDMGFGSHFTLGGFGTGTIIKSEIDGHDNRVVTAAHVLPENKNKNSTIFAFNRDGRFLGELTPEVSGAEPGEALVDGHPTNKSAKTDISTLRIDREGRFANWVPENWNDIGVPLASDVPAHIIGFYLSQDSILSNGGASGGGMFNNKGELVAVTSAGSFLKEGDRAKTNVYTQFSTMLRAKDRSEYPTGIWRMREPSIEAVNTGGLMYSVPAVQDEVRESLGYSNIAPGEGMSKPQEALVVGFPKGVCEDRIVKTVPFKSIEVPTQLKWSGWLAHMFEVERGQSRNDI